MNASAENVARWKQMVLVSAKMMEHALRSQLRCDPIVQIGQVRFDFRTEGTILRESNIYLERIVTIEAPALIKQHFIEKCECGDSCEMKNGEEGLCDLMGRCHPEDRPPNCDEWDECECGKRCKMETGSVGICQNNGSCTQTSMRPNCTDWPGNIQTLLHEHFSRIL